MDELIYLFVHWSVYLLIHHTDYVDDGDGHDHDTFLNALMKSFLDISYSLLTITC